MLQVVRYHSLVVNENTLPKELIPTAWTCSSNTNSFLKTSCLNPDAYNNKGSHRSSPAYLGEGSSLLSSHADCAQSEKVLMGIRHVSRPHYGLQVLSASITINMCPLSIFILC